MMMAPKIGVAKAIEDRYLSDIGIGDLMFKPVKEPGYLVGIFIIDSGGQPRFRHIYKSIDEARVDARSWLANGYFDMDAGNGRHDLYPPSQIRKIRFMRITKLITKPATEEAAEFGVTDEESHWCDSTGAVIDPFATVM